MEKWKASPTPAKGFRRRFGLSFAAASALLIVAAAFSASRIDSAARLVAVSAPTTLSADGAANSSSSFSNRIAAEDDAVVAAEGSNTAPSLQEVLTVAAGGRADAAGAVEEDAAGSNSTAAQALQSPLEAKEEEEAAVAAVAAAAATELIPVVLDPPPPPPPQADPWKKGEEATEREWRPLCDFSNRRINRCELAGDVRISGKNASVTLVAPPGAGGWFKEESWRVKPYPRKADPAAMGGVTEVTVTSVRAGGEPSPPQCTEHLDVPAVIFSDRGYTGNFFHDFTDVILPMFLTARQFDGEVQFLVTRFMSWWIHKYMPIIKKLSNYDVVDFDADDRVRCYPRAFVGFISHHDFSLDPSTAPNNYSTADFTQFMRDVYALPRHAVAGVGRPPFRRPRMLILSRRRTRRFANMEDIVKAVEKNGFEAVVAESDINTNVGGFAAVVNSCDAVMGVHGAGLTNMVFLPRHAVAIQVVPWGGLEWVAASYFRLPARDMELTYIEYSIAANESTLADEYPPWHPVFANPASIRSRGWNEMKVFFLDKQNVRLDTRRFRPVLKKAMSELKKHSV